MLWDATLPEMTGLTIFMQHSKLSPEVILVCHKIMRHPTFDLKVCVKLDFVQREPGKLQFSCIFDFLQLNCETYSGCLYILSMARGPVSKTSKICDFSAFDKFFKNT
jgi:hypothetical protein